MSEQASKVFTREQFDEAVAAALNSDHPEKIYDYFGTPIGDDTSDGYHTFGELYRYRMLYNAALLNAEYKLDRVQCALAGLDFGEYDCGKSWLHSDGNPPFDGGYFIVWIRLNNGQIVSNHYENRWWDLFDIPEYETAPEWDGSSPKDQADELEHMLLLPLWRPTQCTVRRMVERVNERLLPLCRYDGFEPYQDVYRLGDNGYVTKAEWNDAFCIEPIWAEDAYLLVGNGWTCEQVGEWEDKNKQYLCDAVARMFNDGETDHAVFATEADETGHV